MKPITVQSFLLAVALVPAIVLVRPAVAQVDLSQSITGGFNSTFTSTQTRSTQASNIVISVRDFSQTDDFCGSSVISFLRPSSAGDGFDFPYAGRQSNSVLRSGRSITSFAGGTTYFQLPTGARNPDIVGCVDTQRNTVFITIKSQRLATPAQPQLEPSLPPVQIPSTQTFPSNATLTYPQIQRLMPQQSQSFPAGVPANNGLK